MYGGSSAGISNAAGSETGTVIGNIISGHDNTIRKVLEAVREKPKHDSAAGTTGVQRELFFP
jgi:hypothetical protein